MSITYKGPGAGPFSFSDSASANEIIVVLGTTEGDVTLSSSEYTVTLNSNQKRNAGGTVTLSEAVPDGVYVTIGTGDVSTPSNLTPTGTVLSSANPSDESYTSPDEEFATIHLTGDIYADFNTAPGEKTILTKVNAAAFAAKAEYAEQAKSAEYAEETSRAKVADKATSATSAQTATTAQTADKATHAVTADSATTAVTATRSEYADSAGYANKADIAVAATQAEKAVRANLAVESDFAWNANTAEKAKTLAEGVVVNDAVNSQYSKLARLAHDSFEASHAAMALEADYAKKAYQSTWATAADVANMARYDCHGHLIYEWYLSKEEAARTYPDYEYVTTALAEKADKEELLKTAEVGGKALGTGVVNGTNLELTITQISGLIVGDDGDLHPLLDPSDWFLWVDSIADIEDPTKSHVIPGDSTYTFPVQTTQFLWDTQIPASFNPSDILCIYGKDGIIQEDSLIGWAFRFDEDLDKHKVWNIYYDNGDALASLPEKYAYRVIYNPEIGWHTLLAPLSPHDRQTIDEILAKNEEQDQRIEELENRVEELEIYLKNFETASLLTIQDLIYFSASKYADVRGMNPKKMYGILNLHKSDIENKQSYTVFTLQDFLVLASADEADVENMDIHKLYGVLDIPAEDIENSTQPISRSIQELSVFAIGEFDGEEVETDKMYLVEAA